jgi:hypothetical protein
MDELTALNAFRPATPPDARAAAVARRALRARMRERKRLLRPRVLLAATLLAAAGVTAATASGLGDRVRDFVAGEPAPRPVQQQFDLSSRRKSVIPWMAQDPRYRAVASKAEGVLAIETSVGPVYVWVAPTVGGGECELLDIAALPLRTGGLSCSPQPVRLDHVPRAGVRETRVGDRYLRLLQGRVAPDVASIEVRFTDGKKATIPTAKGFFLRELTENEEPKLLIARDADGRELGRHVHRRFSFPGRSYIARPTGPYRTVIEVETSWGYPMTLSVAPGANGTVCTETRYRGMRAGSCGQRRPAEDAIRVGIGLWNEPPDGKPLVKLEGSVGGSIARLELEYRDGGRVDVPIVEGYVLFELSRKREPKQLVGYAADGSVVARRGFG